MVLATIWADCMKIVGAPATHQDVIFRVTDQTGRTSHVAIFVRVDNAVAGCQAGDVFVEESETKIF